MHFHQLFKNFVFLFFVLTLMHLVFEISLDFGQNAVDNHSLWRLSVAVLTAPLQRKPSELEVIFRAILEVPLKVVWVNKSMTGYRSSPRADSIRIVLAFLRWSIDTIMRATCSVNLLISRNGYLKVAVLDRFLTSLLIVKAATPQLQIDGLCSLCTRFAIR